MFYGCCMNVSNVSIFPHTSKNWQISYCFLVSRLFENGFISMKSYTNYRFPTAQNMKLSIKGFFSQSEQICWKLRICFPVDVCLLRVNNRRTRIRCEICLKLTIKTPEQRQWRTSGVFIINFEHILHLVFLLLTLSM